ncbi:nickel-dependent hydrogenase large subunit [Halovenus salina]|uniref:nickel-dependent hydrogenase large subunit n=1 Tax=Halovenus salina TaxID=1510225 RepID=UPI00226084D8|nr:nickel-dependent hydrogenase large subunit [Halovenus salina]
MPEIEIDPTTRIEGHHSTTLQVDDGVVTEAKSHMDMFRGMEMVVLDRPPSDAPVFTQRVCGVCFTVHRMSSLLAIENAAKRAGVFDGVPETARQMRNLLERIATLWNHAVHMFALVGPDYSDAVAGTGLERLDPMEGEGYKRALEAQRELLQGFAEFGGKAPHPLTYAPGGMSATPTAGKLQNIRDQVEFVSDWLGPTDAVPEVIENVRNDEFDPDLGEGLHDIVSLLFAAKEAGADDFGVGPGRYYCNGIYPDGDGNREIPPGIYVDGELSHPDKADITSAISESTARSWYTDDSGGHPMEESPPKPDPEKEGAYSWGKAPRYDGMNMETGSLARLIVTERDPFDLRATLGGDPTKSSTLNRLIARAQESLLLRDQILDLLGDIEPDSTVNHGWTDDFSGEGVGLWEASRGALSHWVKIEDGTITNYQIITPTLWNLGPRDESGIPSIFEGAVEGMAVEDYENPINVMRTVRSFDPCLACSVHVESPAGTYSEEVTPASPASVATGGDRPYAGQEVDEQ